MKITETKYKYDTDGKLIEKTETITEYDDGYKYVPSVPYYPWQPTITYKQPNTYDYTITCQSDCSANTDGLMKLINDNCKRTIGW